MLLAEFRDGLERTVSGFPGMCVAVTSPEIPHSRYGVDLREELFVETEPAVLIVRPRRAIPATGGKEAAIASTPHRDRDNR